MKPYACQKFTQSRMCRYDKRPEDTRCDGCPRSSDMEYLVGQGIDVASFAKRGDMPNEVFDGIPAKLGRRMQKGGRIIEAEFCFDSRFEAKWPHFIHYSALDVGIAFGPFAVRRGFFGNAKEVREALSQMDGEMIAMGWEPC